MLLANLYPLFIEIMLVLAIFTTLFSWEFCLLELGAIVLYIIITNSMTEQRL